MPLSRLVPLRPKRSARPACLGALGLTALLLLSPHAPAQPADEPGDDDPPGPAAPAVGTDPGEIPADWKGAVRLLRLPGPKTGIPEARAATEIFPDARKVWMSVQGTDPRPIEAARRGLRPWVCSGGCVLSLPTESEDEGEEEESEQNGLGEAPSPGDAMLRSIKLQTPVQPLPLTIWRPTKRASVTTQEQTISGAITTGQLLFDPVLLGRRSYRHVCAYAPVDESKPPKPDEDVPQCRPGPRVKPTPDSAELTLGFQWPRVSELVDFEYIAIVDNCGNARVQPFQRTFTVPVFEVASGGCGKADGKVLRVFPAGGWMRVTAFNLSAPAAGNVVSATFRVTIPPLEDLVSADTPPLLFPDPKIEDLVVDCGLELRKARPGPGGIPRPPPGASAPPGKAPPGKAPPGKAPPSEGADGKDADPDGDAAKADKVPVVRRPRAVPTRSLEGQPLAHQDLVIAPEPLQLGRCRVELRGQTKRRLVAPLALRVRLSRTDKSFLPGGNVLFDEPWIITPTAPPFRMPRLDPQRFDGESSLVLEVYSDPLSADGNVVLLSDAGRMARVQNIALVGLEEEYGTKLRRLIGSVNIYSAPLCGDDNFETVEEVGNCLRGYFTVPAMLATLQVTRAPWVERPIITRKVLSAIGIAFAMDSYDPVAREAFPIALQVGGFIQDLGEDRMGLTTYLGAAPTVPILGEGGNTTSIGLLGGIGLTYVANNVGPDEGFKPAAFVSIVVQVGQANPVVQGQHQSFGTYVPPPPPAEQKEFEY